ncbi:caspase family protein [Microseira wollei]|uniref:Peptidase C14, caspase catalytic subunit p20 n=1 Tax=Microseira wollei NIES-4236 TaxID=2530354 RepID=A0AAV3XEK5_9CYAN|nr:caspase family protein [Microseira wollei]GET37842.1 peptidase C14, caspase catalytic subunit p20 [Microseira wollei NIES-4236]
MFRISRRQFLLFAGSALATWGCNQFYIQRQGDRYARSLAQNTSRKLALLVGINDYANTKEFTPLRGCITDVELQRELLIYRFGFNPKDIITLTNAQASRQGILTAFEEHLIKQAKPEDVVVFHYSGHGSRVADPDKDFPDRLNGTFVPIDAGLPSGFPQQGGVVQDIMGHTLFLLMKAVPSENLTVVLDSCYSGGGTRGNFRIRSRDGGSQLQISAAEKGYQEQWLSRLNLSPQDFITQRRQGVAKGVVIAAAQRNQRAADAPFSEFYAGAFTYLMTQYLWQQTGNVENAIANIIRDIKPLSFQVPLTDVQPQSGNEKKPVYFIDQQVPPAEAVIIEVKGNQATLWLGGIDRESLAAFDKEAIFTIVDASGGSAGQVTLESRQGLIGKAKLEGAAKEGALLQEAARAIPSDLKLRIGLDLSLGADASAAKQALQAIKRIEAVNVPYQGDVQYLLGRITAADRQAFSSKGQAEVPAEASISLFSPGRDEVIPDSFGEAGETVTKAVSRLEAKLKSLLAVRIVKMTLNANSSRLKVTASMHPEGQNQLIAQAFTARSGISRERSATLSHKLPLGTPIQFQVTNQETRPLYLSILLVDPTGGLTVLFPNQWRQSEEATRLEAGQTLQIPNTNQDEFELVAQAKGIGEMLIIASISPLKKALLTLQSLAQELQQSRGPVVLGRGSRSAEDVMGDLLSDLSSDRSGNGPVVGVRYKVRAAEIAALSITFEVI